MTDTEILDWLQASSARIWRDPRASVAVVWCWYVGPDGRIERRGFDVGLPHPGWHEDLRDAIREAMVKNAPKTD